MAGEDTREKLLDAAEQLFAEHGIFGTTLRALTRSAKVNLAAVHYHFGGKEGLLDAVVERRATAMNRERLRELEELERSAGDRAPRVGDILRELQGRPVASVSMIERLIYESKVGDRLEFVAERQGETWRGALDIKELNLDELR